MPSVTHARTISVLLDTIAAALNRDGASVGPDDIDASGMSIVIDGLSFRLEIAEPELMDDAEWRCTVARRDSHTVSVWNPSTKQYETVLRSTLAAGGENIDPAGFNGMGSPDDIEF